MGREVTGSKAYRLFLTRWGIIFESFGIALALIAVKSIIDFLGFTFISLNSLITAILSGVFFTIGLIFAGAATDYKEAEKLPGLVAVSFRSLIYDINLIKEENRLKALVHDLLKKVNHGFRKNSMDFSKIDFTFDSINKELSRLSLEASSPSYILKLRSELTCLDHNLHRIKTISETTFLPSAFSLSEISVCFMILIMTFIEIDGYYIYVLYFATFMILISLLNIIRDMDNPFEYGRNTHADVSLDCLFRLEDHIVEEE